MAARSVLDPSYHPGKLDISGASPLALSGSWYQKYTRQLSRLRLQMCNTEVNELWFSELPSECPRCFSWRCRVTGGGNTNVLGPGVQLGTCRAANEAQAPFLQLSCSAAVYTKPGRASAHVQPCPSSASPRGDRGVLSVAGLQLL